MSPIVRTRQVLSTFLLAALPAAAQTPTSPQATVTPVGHWVAERSSHGGIGSWWDFRPDGTLTMSIGAMVTSAITRTGDTITSPPVTVNGPPITVTYRIEGDTLHLASAGKPEQTLARIGPALSTIDPLLGRWRPLLPATPSADPEMAAQQKLMTTATLAFFADNTESVRIPFNTSEGTWDATAHTFHLNNRKETYRFQLTGAKLSLGQPPDGLKTETYIPDPIL